MRRLTLFVPLALGASLLSGCGSSSSQAASTGAAGCKPIVAGVKTVNPGKLTMAIAEYPPYVSMAGGSLSGVDGVVLKEVAKALCLQPDPQTMSFPAIIESVKSGRADLTAGNWYINAERASTFELSKPVYRDLMALLTKSGANNLNQIAGQKVGTTQGYLWVQDLQKTFGIGNVKLYATEDAVFQDVAVGRVQAGVMTYGAATQLLKANKNDTLKVEILQPDPRVQASVGVAQTAVLVQKGNTALRDAVDQVVGEMRASGALKKALEDSGLKSDAADVQAK